MKRLGILFGLLVLSAGMIFAQDSTSTTTTSDRDASQDTQEQSQRNAHKAAASNDASDADQEKADAKDASTKGGEDRDKVIARLDDSSKVLNELLGAPDNGIPDDVFKNAKCVAVVPSMVKGGFVFGAEHGRGVATCRTANGWSAPAPFVITGGSWGAQIGGAGCRSGHADHERQRHERSAELEVQAGRQRQRGCWVRLDATPALPPTGR